MTRRILRAAYWPAVLIAAAIAMTIAPIPFTGIAANTASILTAAAVLIAGLACEPRKDGSR